MIVVNFNRVLMDYFWDDSEAFRPERFIDDEGKLSIPEQFLPFSFGKIIFLYYKTEIIKKNKNYYCFEKKETKLT